MNWIRLSSEYPRHRKTLRLVSELGPVAVTYPIFLWLWAAEQSQEGTLLDMEPDELALIVGHQGDASELWAAMAECGFIEHAEGEWRVRSWHEYQGLLAERAKRNRERMRAARARTVRAQTANVPSTESEPCANAPAPMPAPVPLPMPVPPAPPVPPKPPKKKAPPADLSDFDAFWKAYPVKKDKPDALKAWKQTEKERPPLPQILAALRADIESKRRKSDWLDYMKYPAGWLRKHSWANEVLVERVTHSGPVVVPMPAMQTEIEKPEPYALPADQPTTKEEIERELWVDTFASHGLPGAAEEARTCSMERLRELQGVHKAAIERRRAEVRERLLRRGAA